MVRGAGGISVGVLWKATQALARIKHPNIVHVIGGGMTAEPAPRSYFVMEKLDGDTLYAVMRRRAKAFTIRRAFVVSSSDKRRRLFVVHRSGDSGSPRVVGSMSDSIVATPGSGGQQARFVGPLRCAVSDARLHIVIQPSRRSAPIIVYETCAAERTLDARAMNALSAMHACVVVGGELVEMRSYIHNAIPFGILDSPNTVVVGERNCCANGS